MISDQLSLIRAMAKNEIDISYLQFDCKLEINKAFCCSAFDADHDFFLFLMPNRFPSSLFLQ